jgi:deoxyadenosine/deoxycytidine kinase
MLKVLVVDGFIGAGKTTLIGILSDFLSQKGLKVCTIYEPVDQWKSSGALARFYENVAQRAYEFQTYAFATRVKAIREAYNQNKNADIFILERSIYSDRYVFTEMLKKHFDKTLTMMYNEWWNLFKEVLPREFWIENVKFIYLRPTLETCMERVHIRDRVEEQSAVSSNYQHDLQIAYDIFMKDKDPIIIEGDYDCKFCDDDRKIVLNKIYSSFDNLTEPIESIV